MIPLSIALAVLGSIAAFGPGFFLRGERVSGQELAQRRPDLAWVRWGFPLIKALWILCVVCPVLVLLMVVFPDCARRSGYYLLGAVFSCLAMSSGTLGALTGVYSRLGLAMIPYFYYLDQPRLIGLAQLCLALAVLAVSLPLFIWACTSGGM